MKTTRNNLWKQTLAAALLLLLASPLVQAVAVRLIDSAGSPLPSASLQFDAQPAEEKEDRDRRGFFILLPGSRGISYRTPDGKTHTQNVIIPDAAEATVVFDPATGLFTVTGTSAGGDWQFNFEVQAGAQRTRGRGRLNSLFGNDSASFSRTDGQLTLLLTALPPGTPFFFGFGLGVSETDRDRFISLDLHPTPGRDSHLSVRPSPLSGQAFAGFDIFQLQPGENIAFFPADGHSGGLLVQAGAGVGVSRTRLNLKTDETGGGGIRESFTENDTDCGLLAFIRASLPLANGGSLAAGVEWQRLGDVSVNGASSTFGFPYSGSLRRINQWRAFLGLIIPL